MRWMRICWPATYFKNLTAGEPPAPEIRYLGALLRRRDVLLGDALREENRLEKYLSTDTIRILSVPAWLAQLLRDDKQYRAAD
jgi:hypothetical protein